MIKIPIVLSKQQQAQVIANYMPGGKAFAAKNILGTNIRKWLLGFAREFLRVDALIALFRVDTVPDKTQYYISEWESAVGIPDDCFKGTGDDTERRLHIIMKLAKSGLQTGQDFVDFAAKLGIPIEVESGAIHGAFPFIFPIKFYPSGEAAHHTIIVRATETIGATFPYIFPIVFGTNDFALLECLFKKLKPANVDVVFENPF